MGNQQPRPKGKVQRLSLMGVGCKRIRSGSPRQGDDIVYTVRKRTARSRDPKNKLECLSKFRKNNGV